MKKSATGLLCLGLLLATWARTGLAQTQPTGTPPAEPSAAPAGQDPQAPAPAASASPQTPPQTGQPNIQAPPELPKFPDVRMPGEYGFWIGVTGSQPTGHPIIDHGHVSGLTNASRLTLQGTPNVGEGAEAGIALGLHNALRISFFQTKAGGSIAAPTDLTLWSTDYNKGDRISTNYRLKDFKISFDYLTWPYPVGNRRFRLKTLWQVQYVSIKSTFNAPDLPVTDSSGNALLDSSGNILSYVSQGSKWFVLPTLGLGMHEYVSRHLRFEANASGFTLPHHTTLWDADASVNIRAGHFEIGGGVRAFHFKTSTQGTYYMRGTLVAPQVSIRWFSE